MPGVFRLNFPVDPIAEWLFHRWRFWPPRRPPRPFFFVPLREVWERWFFYRCFLHPSLFLIISLIGDLSDEGVDNA